MGWGGPLSPPGTESHGAPTGRILQKDEGLNILLSIPDSAKVVAFKPEHPGLWSIKVGGAGFWAVGGPGSWEAEGWGVGVLWAHQ